MLACQGVEAGLTWQNILAILEGMEDHIQVLLALGIGTDKKKKNKILCLGVWKAQGLRKDGSGRYLALKGEKGKKFSFVCKDRLRHHFYLTLDLVVCMAVCKIKIIISQVSAAHDAMVEGLPVRST